MTLQSYCKYCGVEHPQTAEYWVHNGNNRYLCREYNYTRTRKWRQNNKKLHQEINKVWSKNNPDKVRKHRKTYHDKNYGINIAYTLRKRLRTRLRSAIKRRQKIGSAILDLGCSIEYLQTYLESKFQPGMSWDNYGKWHIDHIIPLSKFDLQDIDQFSKAVHYTNLQPLWAVDNLIKGSQVPGEGV